MEVGILGTLEVTDEGGRRLDLGAPRQRAVFAILVVYLNQVVSIDRLVDELWGESPPSAATASLQAYVSNLRRVLEPGRKPRTPAAVLVTEPPGYALRVPPDRLDAVRFERLAAEGRAALVAGDAAAAVAVLGAALELWRGEALADFAYQPFALPEAARLNELRVCAEEDRLEGRLVIGDHASACATIEALVSVHPLRERLRALQIQALYLSGRQAEALRAYEDTRRLLAEELGLHPGPELQGLQRQVLEHDPVLGVITASARPRPTPALADRVPARQVARFVGRDTALAVLRQALDRALAGETQLVLVEGEPGIGKTRLATEFASRVAPSGLVVSWGRCHDDEGAPPLWPWVQVLRSIGVPDAGAPGHLRTVLSALLPELGRPTNANLDAEIERFRLYDAVREVIERQAAARPTMLVLDDLQWADLSSLRLLRFLGVELHQAPVLVVVTFRDAEEFMTAPLFDTLAELQRRTDIERVKLTGLGVDDVTDFIRSSTEIDDDDIAGTAIEVHRRTNGNPFFVTELVRLLESERRFGSVAPAGDVPAAVGDVIRQRLRRLPDELQTVLGVAALVGRVFDVDVVARACGLDVDRTIEILEAALATRLVVAEGPEQYRFAHAIVTETLYGDLSPARQARLHGRVGEATETAYTADLEPHYTALAHHYGRAPIVYGQRALKFAQLAGHQSTRTLAYDEAVVHWRAALAQLERSENPPLTLRARILLDLATALRRAGQLADSSSINDEALAVAERTGDLSLLAEAALTYGETGLLQVRRYGTINEQVVAAMSRVLSAIEEADSALRARLLGGLGIALYYRDDDRERGRNVTREAAAMARRLGDRRLLATTLVEMLLMLDDAADHTEQLHVAAELASFDRSDIPADVAPTLVARSARVALAAGDASGLEGDIARYAREAREARQPNEVLWSTWAQAAVAFLRGRLSEAERLAGEAFTLHEQLGSWGGPETYALHMVQVWREQGRLDEVAPLVEPLLIQATHPGATKLRGVFALERGEPEQIGALLGPDPIPRSRDFTWLAEVCVTAELAAAAALPCVDELYRTLLPFQHRVVTMDATYICLGSASYHLGLLAHALGRPDNAATYFRHAVAVNDAIGAVPWSVRTRYHLAKTLRPSDPNGADDQLRTALAAARAHELVAMRRRLQAELQHGG